MTGLVGATGPGPLGPGGNAGSNLGDVLERVLDKGIVIVGDIRVNLVDIELLTIKLRLVVASIETAKRVGIDWWETDPWFTAHSGRADLDDGDGERVALARENSALRERIAELEAAAEVPGDVRRA